MPAPKNIAEFEIVPQPSKAEIDKSRQRGAKIVSYSPDRLEAFIRGQITLGELDGVPKEAQYQVASLGYEFLAEGKLDKARQVFEGLLALDPYDAYFHTAIGCVAQRLNFFDEAEKRYSRALEIDPNSAQALANRGEVRVCLGRIEEGIRDLVAAVQGDAHGQAPYIKRARALLESLRRQIAASQPQKAQANNARRVAQGALRSTKPTKPIKKRS